MSKTLRLFYFLILAMLILSACNDESASQEDEMKDPDLNEISILAPLHSAETPDSGIEEKIEKLTGVELDLQYVPANNYQDRMSTSFATDSMPEVANIPIEGTFKEAIRDGQFWEIEPYLDDFENLKKLKPEILDNMRIDGKLYSLYQGRPLSRQGIIYRKDWADNLGLDTPKTTEDFMEMVKQFTENDPDANGKDDTIGLSDRGDLAYGSFNTIASWFGAPHEWGEIDGELKPAFMFPQYQEALDFMREMHESGYINQDFPVTSKPDQQDMIKNGRAGVYVGCMCDVNGLASDGKLINPEMELDVHNQISKAGEKYQIWSIPGYNHPYFFPKSSVETEEELLIILEFFNKMMEPEVANTVFWGEEGEHYTVEDGKAVTIDDQNKLDREVIPYQTFEVGEPETNGRYEGQFDLKARQKAENLFKDNEKYLIKDPTITLDSETYDQKSEELKQIMVDATFNYILGDLDKAGFEEQIERWMDHGGNDVIEEFNISWKASN
ncbi:extracellular solute-binding protein [Saliterribacillus persicus]|uniref:Putative aldouronate transport system substrate-binding protein n=1 Tax=Saliterribacillus persicus TaxID=930114 RepID=A0A368XE44_9BACI|nr:extracellular solute-binding protein [Saliterribacillus persicus]RCW64284.1 putative aldouronate transport system substrate-binding protein [Saliterribacillus persicus]